jgi:hypothetical protein
MGYYKSGKFLLILILMLFAIIFLFPRLANADCNLPGMLLNDGSAPYRAITISDVGTVNATLNGFLPAPIWPVYDLSAPWAFITIGDMGNSNANLNLFFNVFLPPPQDVFGNELPVDIFVNPGSDTIVMPPGPATLIADITNFVVEPFPDTFTVENIPISWRIIDDPSGGAELSGISITGPTSGTEILNIPVAITTEAGTGTSTVYLTPGPICNVTITVEAYLNILNPDNAQNDPVCGFPPLITVLKTITRPFGVYVSP